MKTSAFLVFCFLAFFGTLSDVPGQKNYASSIQILGKRGDRVIYNYVVSLTDPESYYEVNFILTSSDGDTVKYDKKLIASDLQLGEPVRVENKEDNTIVWYYAREESTWNPDDLKPIIEVYLIPPPLASFSFNAGDGEAPQLVSFINESKNADTYTWNFGDTDSNDKNSSTDPNPTHYYEKAGNYTVLLTAESNNPKRTSPSTKVVRLREPPKHPVASFIAVGDGERAPTEVSFENRSSNADIFSWNFGDPDSGENNTSDLPNPKHYYTRKGNYNVVLTCINEQSGISDQDTKAVIILEAVKQPAADFSYEVSKKRDGFEVEFTNMSSEFESCEWNFDDELSNSNTSKQINPIHTYEKARVYDVNLIVYSIERILSDTLTKQIDLGPSPEAGITWKSNQAFRVYFYSNSSNTHIWDWDFGDPNSDNRSTKKNDLHTFSGPGEYEIKLKVTNKDSGKEKEYTLSIRIDEKGCVEEF